MTPALEQAAVDHREYVDGVRSATRLGLWTWPSFTLLDFFMAWVLDSPAPSWHFLVVRLLGEMLLLGSYFYVFRPSRPHLLVTYCHAATFAAICMLIAVIAINFGGLTSVYVHGTTVAMLVQTTLVLENWRKRAAVLGAMAFAYPFTLAVAALYVPSLAEQWRTPATLLTFVCNYAFVLACGLLGALGGHIVWAARHQLYQARRLGRFRLKVPIGRGGMAEVWLAHDGLRKGAAVALKVLRSSSNLEPMVKRFEREARAISMLRSPHTVSVIDYGASDDGLYYIAMELLRGFDLGDLVRTHGPLPAARVVALVRQACESLEEAHAAGIVHRDIKPENLFVARVGQQHDFVKLLDFGIALVETREPEVALTSTGVVLGTPAFMAPEVLAGGKADPRSDLYGLGVTMHFMLTGAPSSGRGGDPTVDLKPGRAPHNDGRSDNRTGSRELLALVNRCTAICPEKRFQSASELAAALAAVPEADAWTEVDARRFWFEERPARLARLATMP